MNTKEKIEVMQARLDGKKIEGRFTSNPCDPWEIVPVPSWNWARFDYRIAPEPKKAEGRWERVEIEEKGGDWRLKNPVNGWERIVYLPNIPGFGGIDYQSPFDEKHIVRSMAPVMFDPFTGHAVIMGFAQADSRPGIPVAAWFWREGEK